jgi:PAT family beta-lactamase induction signal transducer AmpG
MKRYPWLYVPTLYFAESLPYNIVNSISTFIYKSMGVSNVTIGLTSYLYLPWVIKMFWGPLVDLYATKRLWIVGMQLFIVAAFGVCAMVLFSPSFLILSLVVMTVIAFLSATHDIATDGFYMLALSPERQAFYTGLRALFYRLGTIFVIGGLVVWAGRMEKSTGNIPGAWSKILWIAAGIFSALFLFHLLYLPRPAADARRQRHSEGQSSAPFLEVFRAYFQQPRIAIIVTFILLYRLSEAMVVKMLVPFMRDSRAAGGLSLGTDTVGFAYGTIGIVSLVVGGLLGGWLIARFGLRRCFWPMAVALNTPDVGYIFLAKAKEPLLPVVYGVVALEQFGYGMGFTAFMVFLMYTSKGPYKTAHYAISTGLMALGMMLPGMLSGKLQQLLGYPNFFVMILIAAIPGMLVIPFLPIGEEVTEVPRDIDLS